MYKRSVLILILIRIGIGNNPPQQSNYRKHSRKRLQLTVTRAIHIVQQCRLVTNVVYHVTHQVNFFILKNYISTQSSITLRSCKVAIIMMMMLLTCLAHLFIIKISTFLF